MILAIPSQGLQSRIKSLAKNQFQNELQEKTIKVPAPEPATPIVAAPAPMYLAALSISRRAVEVCKHRAATAHSALKAAGTRCT